MEKLWVDKVGILGCNGVGRHGSNYFLVFYFIFKYKICKLKNRLQERNQNTTTLGELAQAKGNSRNNGHMGSNLQRGQTSYKYVEGLDMDLCDHYPSLVGTCIWVIYEISCKGLYFNTNTIKTRVMMRLDDVLIYRYHYKFNT